MCICFWRPHVCIHTKTYFLRRKPQHIFTTFSTFRNEFLIPSLVTFMFCSMHGSTRAMRAHLPVTARAKPSSTQEQCLLSLGREILEQTAGTSCPVTLSIYLHLNNWTVNVPKSFLQHLFYFCSHSLTFLSILFP